jgi:octaprenyl-diphosphate synthase
MVIQDVYQLVAADRAAVDQIIRDKLRSDVVLVNQISHYIIQSGGKRLRPLLLLLTARAAGYSGADHLQLAAVVEFIHTATLLHDDVVDESALRRGRDTANHVWGNAASVLVGDFLYSRSFQMMVEVGNMRVMEILADATNVIAEGEVMQLLNIHNADISLDEYLHVVRSKTAKLFDAAARIGPLLAGASDAVVAAIGRYGMHLGTAFQLVDDALDYSADSTSLGKNIGDDLAEGKPTLPLIYVLQYGTPEEQQLIRQVIEQEEGGREQISAVMAALTANHAIERTLAYAAVEVESAIAELAAFPPSPYRDALSQVARYAVDRLH